MNYKRRSQLNIFKRHKGSCRLAQVPLLAWVSLLASVFLGSANAASLIEETLQVPVTVRLPGAAAASISRQIAVRVVREAVAERRPFLILLHGRAADPQGRARLALPIYPANSRYFAAQGFVVLIPLRVGYGITPDPDLEVSGDCQFKRYLDAVLPAVAQTGAVIEFAHSLPFVDIAHGILVGESFGGLVAIAAAAEPPAGVVAAVNVAGGDGGDSRERPDAPCRPDQLREAFAHYGKMSRIPTLWLYSANDRLWGPLYPHEWYRAFVGAGGTATYAALPADKNNGHFIFNRNASAWHPAFERFIATLRLAKPAPP